MSTYGDPADQVLEAPIPTDIGLEQGPGLRHGSVGLTGTIAQSLSVIAPAMSGAFITYLVALKAGGAAPLAYVLAMGACMILAGVIKEFASRLPSAGSLYTYTANGLGPVAGWITGWAYTIGLIFAGVAVLAGFGSFVSLVAIDRGLPTIFQQWYLWAAVGLVLYFVLSYYDVRFSTRTEVVVAALTAGALLLLAFIIIGDGGAQGNTLDAFSPGAAGVSFGLVLGGLAFGILSFTGFETAAVLAEESDNPRRNVPLAIFSAVLIAGAFYVVMTYATSIGYGVEAATTKWPESAGGLQPLAAEYAGWLSNWVLLAGGVAALFCGLGLHNAITRMLFAMGREGMLPAALGRAHPKRQTPHVAIVVHLAIMVVLTLLLVFTVSQATREALGAGTTGQLAAGFYVFTEGLTICTPPIMFGYVMLSLAGLRFGAQRRAEAASGRLVALSIGGVCVALAAVWSSLYYSFVEAAPGAGIPGPYKAVPWLCVAILVLGVLLGLFLRARRQSAWQNMGTVFE
jgi:amino acid transporter